MAWFHTFASATDRACGNRAKFMLVASRQASRSVSVTLSRIVVAIALSGAILGPGPATALYAYLPDLLVVSAPDDADAWLSETEIAMGAQGAEDPLWADRPDLKRLDRTERIMTKHWERLDADCDPNAVFALMYLVTTRGVRAHIQEGYFAENDYLAIITVAFAKLYLDSYDAWQAGDRASVQLGWLEAFDYATTGQSSITEDEFLGMNAHINYDLAVAEAAVGITNAAGESRKPDMDRINHVLADVTDDVGYWIAYYYGPTPPTTLPSSAHTQSSDPEDLLANPTLAILEPVYGWREQAWLNAEFISSDPDPTALAAHDAQMQAYAWTVAQGLHSPKTISPAAERIAYCESS